MIAYSFHPIASGVAGEAASVGQGKLIERSAASVGGAEGRYRAARQQRLIEQALIDRVCCLLDARRLPIPRMLVADYYISLKTNQFVVFTGSSAGVAAQLSRSLADALIGPGGGQFLEIDGDAEWTAGTGEGGYYRSLLERFDALRLLDVLQEAAAPGNAGKVYLLCLNGLHPGELNHYFTHLLRATPAGEQRLALPGLAVWQQPVVPANLYITATIAGSLSSVRLDAQVMQRAGLLELPPELDLPAHAPASPMVAMVPAGYQRRMTGSAGQGLDAARRKLAAVLSPAQLAVAHASFDLSQLLWRLGAPLSSRIQCYLTRYVANSFDEEGRGLFEPNDALHNARLALDNVVAQQVLWQLYNDPDEQLCADLLAYRRRLWAGVVSV